MARNHLIDIATISPGCREVCGRMLHERSRRADTVTRIFCGLPQRLK